MDREMRVCASKIIDVFGQPDMTAASLSRPHKQSQYSNRMSILSHAHLDDLVRRLHLHYFDDHFSVAMHSEDLLFVYKSQKSSANSPAAKDQSWSFVKAAYS